MPAKRTAMRKLREVLRLSYSAGLSIRKISASTKISVGSIQHILKLAVQMNITWPLPEGWDDQTLVLKPTKNRVKLPKTTIIPPRNNFLWRKYIVVF
jgi:hypothetical protein